MHTQIYHNIVSRYMSAGGESQRRHTGIHNMYWYDVEVGREQLVMGDWEGDENKEHGIIDSEQYGSVSLWQRPPQTLPKGQLAPSVSEAATGWPLEIYRSSMFFFGHFHLTTPVCMLVEWSIRWTKLKRKWLLLKRASKLKSQCLRCLCCTNSSNKYKATRC